MITFTKLGEFGRLGNQLFQLALLKYVSCKTGYQICLPNDIDDRIWHGQKCLLKNFKLPSVIRKDIEPEHIFTEKKLRTYDKTVLEVSPMTDFEGYFINANYVKKIIEDLRKEFELIDPIDTKINNLISKERYPVVSLHVRRGDNTDPNVNPIHSKWGNDYSENSPLYKYYNQALSIIPENSKIFLFTGGSRSSDQNNISDLEWCKLHIKDDRIIYVNHLNDLESFCFMSKSDYTICSFTSTFGIWAGYLNKKGTIIVPKKYHPFENQFKNPDDIYFKNWLKIDL